MQRNYSFGIVVIYVIRALRNPNQGAEFNCVLLEKHLRDSSCPQEFGNDKSKNTKHTPFANLYYFTQRIQETYEDHGLTWFTVALHQFLSNHCQDFRTLTAKWTQRRISKKLFFSAF